MNRTSNWSSCNRAIETTTSTLRSTAKELEAAGDVAGREAAIALRAAEIALARAQAAVKHALTRPAMPTLRAA